ncbi:MAG: exosortase/archaeosortase family protein, partial [Vicinamibacteria bacterium]|nr:exosortase/archaeosortase family protein [Vicinamibacteria bacterium]
RKRAFALAVYSCLAAGLPLAGYALIARQVGWDVLLSEGYLLLYNIPAELVYYNRRMFGFDHPWRSLAAMAIVTLRLLTLAALIAALSSWIQRPSGMPLWKACSMRVAAVLLGATLLTHRLADWETGPYYAMPFLLLGVIVALLWRRWRERDPGDSLQWVIVLALSTYALASLARTLLRVRTGVAYSSYLLPPSIIVFTYLWEQGRPALSAMPVRTLSRRIGRGVLILWLVSAAIVTCVRYRANFTYPLSSPRGTMIVKPDLGVVFQKARAFVEERTQPGDPVAIFPEGTALLFLSDRRNPIHEEITTPGFLNEQRAVQRLIAARTRLILIANRPTTEFGAQAFGRDYGQFLMRWVEGRYAVCGFFAAKPRATATIDYGPFFIQAYCPKPATEPFAEGPHAR